MKNKKTLSLPVCRKLSEMGIEVESRLWHIYAEYYGTTPRSKDGIRDYFVADKDGLLLGDSVKRFATIFPAYQLDELPAVLREIGEKNGWKKYVWTSYKEWNDLYLTHYTDSEEYDPPFGEKCPYAQRHITTEYHFMLICQKFFDSGSLGEGSEAECYILDLIK